MVGAGAVGEHGEEPSWLSQESSWCLFGTTSTKWVGISVLLVTLASLFDLDLLAVETDPVFLFLTGASIIACNLVLELVRFGGLLELEDRFFGNLDLERERFLLEPAGVSSTLALEPLRLTVSVAMLCES